SDLGEGWPQLDQAVGQHLPLRLQLDPLVLVQRGAPGLGVEPVGEYLPVLGGINHALDHDAVGLLQRGCGAAPEPADVDVAVHPLAPGGVALDAHRMPALGALGQHGQQGGRGSPAPVCHLPPAGDHALHCAVDVLGHDPLPVSRSSLLAVVRGEPRVPRVKEQGPQVAVVPLATASRSHLPAVQVLDDVDHLLAGKDLAVHPPQLIRLCRHDLAVPGVAERADRPEGPALLHALLVGGTLPGGLVLALVLRHRGDDPGHHAPAVRAQVQLAGMHCVDVEAERDHALQLRGQPDEPVGMPANHDLRVRDQEPLKLGANYAGGCRQVVVREDLPDLPSPALAEGDALLDLPTDVSSGEGPRSVETAPDPQASEPTGSEEAEAEPGGTEYSEEGEPDNTAKIGQKATYSHADEAEITKVKRVRARRYDAHDGAQGAKP